MNRAVEFAAGAAAGAAAAVLVPRGQDTGVPAAPLDLPDGARAVVATGSAMPTWAVAAMGAAAGLVARQALATRAPVDVLGAATVGVLACAFRSVGVIVDDHGLHVSTGLPGRVTLPLHVVESARAVTVTAGEFGGLGLRWSPDRGAGLILRPGDALALETRWGRLVVTVDDAANAAAVIERRLAATKAMSS